MTQPPRVQPRFRVPLNSHKQFRVSAAETISLFLGNIMNCGESRGLREGLSSDKTNPKSQLSLLHANYIRKAGQGSTVHASCHSISLSLCCRNMSSLQTSKKGDWEAKNKAAFWEQHLKLWLGSAFEASCFNST